MLEYLLFDLDGTLTDSSEGITKSVQYGLESIGIEVKDLNDLLVFIGPPLEYSFQEYYKLDGERMQQAIAKYRERYKKIGMYENALYPGMAALLKDMHKRGKHLAVASSKPEVFVRQILKHFNIEQYFEVIVGSGLDGSLGTKSEVVREALRQLFKKEKDKPFALSREQKEITAMIGDRHFDIKGGKDNEIVTVGVEYGFAKEGEFKEAKADYVVKTVEELHQFLLRGSEDADEARMKSYHKAQKQKEIKQKASVKRAEREGKKNASSLSKAFDILLPMVVYFVVYDVAGIIFSFLAGLIGERIGGSFYERMLADAETVRGILVIFTLTVSMAALYPMAKWEFFLKEYGRTGKFVTARQEQEEKGKKIRQGIVLVITAISASLALNLLFMLLSVADLSKQYAQVAERQNSVALIAGIFLYGIFSPLAEEMLFRGLLYNRMKLYFPQKLSMVFSALFFGLYHGNLVQGMFGLILGIVIAWFYERYGKWYVPVVFHGIVNLTSYLLVPHLYSETFSWKGGYWRYLNCAVFMTIWIFGMIYTGKTKKNEKI
ncbi:MAG: HAD hydrolase-like protein [Lachnospiraceae bacterium]|nr:HAD hydrolase-like protein [Lachnospiraceae bacterium]